LTESAGKPRISVLMPTFQQEAFINRAIQSLQAQTFTDWELIIVNDGSPTDPPYPADPRIRCYRHNTNQGLGTALNTALIEARGTYIAYLPSDDVYYADHLASLLACLEQDPAAVLAYSGARHHYNHVATGQIEGYSIQPVQVLHRKTDDRWLTREALVTDDMRRMFWHKLESYGTFVNTGRVTCEWVDHPDQLHKIAREPVGGINTYRAKFKVNHPLRFHTSVGNYIDEVEHYRRFRERPDTPAAPDGLKILLVGELAYNAERVLALEERGHTLYGLWMRDPYWYNTVGPLPFGHVQDISSANWQDEVRRIKPDVIYALLNWQAVPFAHEVLTHNPSVPFVWHFKEGPFICMEKGTWAQMVDLYAKSDGQIYVSPEMRDWTLTFLPGEPDPARMLVLDGDLPKREWFTQDRMPRLSERDGQIHTVVPGRPIGLHPYTVEELARQQIHLHFYGDFTHGQWKQWIDKTMGMAPGFLHLHANVDQERWVEAFSQYDAGWLHFFQSENGGELRRANWDDLNFPARIGTLAAAGLPMLQRDNTGHIVATQTLAREQDLSIFFNDMAELGAKLHDTGQLSRLQDHIWNIRERFTFDYHADALIGFFRKIIDMKG